MTWLSWSEIERKTSDAKICLVFVKLTVSTAIGTARAHRVGIGVAVATEGRMRR
jgi:hypothetical protein